MAKPLIVVADPINQEGIDKLDGAYQVVCLEAGADAATARQALARAEALVVRLFTADAAAMDAAPRLRVIAKHGAGVDNIDIAAATERGIMVTSTPGLNATAVAEAAVGLMLAVAKQVPALHHAVREHRFFEARHGTKLVELTGKTLGVIGAGRIGGKVAGICGRGFAMRVVIYDPYIGDDRIAALGAERAATLSALLDAADLVTVHTPLTDETRGMIDGAALARMRPEAILINTGRGSVVDEAALADALVAGAIRGAGIDVFADEPPAPESALLAATTPGPTGGADRRCRHVVLWRQ